MTEKIELAGVHFDHVPLAKAMELAVGYLKTDPMSTIETATMQTIAAAGESEEVHQCLERMDLILIGDKGILDLAGVASAEEIREVENREFFYEFVKWAAKNEETFFLISQSADEVAELAEFLQELCERKLRICGQYAFETCQGDEEDVVNEINSASPQVVLSTLSAPEQELFLGRHLGMCNAKVWYGIGPEYDVSSSRRGLKNWVKKLKVQFKVRQQVQSYGETEDEK